MHESKESFCVALVPVDVTYINGSTVLAVCIAFVNLACGSNYETDGGTDSHRASSLASSPFSLFALFFLLPLSRSLARLAFGSY